MAKEHAKQASRHEKKGVHSGHSGHAGHSNHAGHANHAGHSGNSGHSGHGGHGNTGPSGQNGHNGHSGHLGHLGHVNGHRNGQANDKGIQAGFGHNPMPRPEQAFSCPEPVQNSVQTWLPGRNEEWYDPGTAPERPTVTDEGVGDFDDYSPPGPAQLQYTQNQTAAFDGSAERQELSEQCLWRYDKQTMQMGHASRFQYAPEWALIVSPEAYHGDQDDGAMPPAHSTSAQHAMALDGPGPVQGDDCIDIDSRNMHFIQSKNFADKASAYKKIGLTFGPDRRNQRQ